MENQILTGRFRPGQRLVEAELTTFFNSSRYWVRDALKLLSEKGLVEIIPYKGAMVKALNAKEIEDTFNIRVTLERMAIHQALPNIKAADLKKLEKSEEQFEKAYRDNNIQKMLTSNAEFHDCIFACANNPTLYQLIVDLRTRLHIIRFSAWSSPGILEKIIQEHQLYIKALREKDRNTLDELCKIHISYSKDLYLLRQKTIESITSQTTPAS